MSDSEFGCCQSSDCQDRWIFFHRTNMVFTDLEPTRYHLPFSTALNSIFIFGTVWNMFFFVFSWSESHFRLEKLRARPKPLIAEFQLWLLRFSGGVFHGTNTYTPEV